MIYIDTQHSHSLFARARDERRLAIDLSQVRMSIFRQRAPENGGVAKDETDHLVPSEEPMDCHSFDFASPIGPEGNVFGQYVHEGSHFAFLQRLLKAEQQSPLRFG